MKNGLGLKKETAAAIATLFGPTLIIPILFILVEKDEFVKFWAMQAVVTMVVFIAISLVSIPLALTIVLAPLVVFLNDIVWLLGFILWLLFVYKAWQGDMWVAPVVGKIAQNLLKKSK